jgi:hypothetical protein
VTALFSPSIPATTGITVGRPAPRWTPAIVRVLSLATALASIAAAAMVVLAIDSSRRALSRTEQPAAVLFAAGDLAVALGDLDGRLATALLASGQPDLAGARQQALDGYERRRSEVAEHLQRLASLVGVDEGMPGAVRSVVDEFGRYQVLAADALRLSAGGSAAPALARYREATDLMHGVLLPTVDDLVRTGDRVAFGHFLDTLQDEELALVVLVTGLPALVLLLALQALLTRRFRRRLHPWLAAATVTLLAAGLAVTPAFDAYRLLGSDKQFEAASHLVQARAVAYDADADRVRFLLDPERANKYQMAFLDKTLALGTERCSGHLARARCSLEYEGLRLETWASVDQTVPALLAYQQADRTIRDLAGAARRDEAVRFAVDPAAFERFDLALAGAVDANRSGLHRMIAEEQRGDLQWMAAALGVCAVVVALLALGVRRRLAEFR